MGNTHASLRCDVMRELYKHERKAIDQLLSRNHCAAYRLPKVLSEILIGPDPVQKQRPRINSGFTLFFHEAGATPTLRRVASALALPGRTESGIFLVTDASTNELAFLELISVTHPPLAAVAPYCDLIADSIENNLNTRCDTHVISLFRNLREERHRGHQFPYVRVIVLDDVLCFFLTNNTDFVLVKPEMENVLRNESTVMDVAWLSHGDYCVDGWVANGRVALLSK